MATSSIGSVIKLNNDMARIMLRERKNKVNRIAYNNKAINTNPDLKKPVGV